MYALHVSTLHSYECLKEYEKEADIKIRVKEYEESIFNEHGKLEFWIEPKKA